MTNTELKQIIKLIEEDIQRKMTKQELSKVLRIEPEIAKKLIQYYNSKYALSISKLLIEGKDISLLLNDLIELKDETNQIVVEIYRKLSQYIFASQDFIKIIMRNVYAMTSAASREFLKSIEFACPKDWPTISRLYCDLSHDELAETLTHHFLYAVQKNTSHELKEEDIEIATAITRQTSVEKAKVIVNTFKYKVQYDKKVLDIIASAPNAKVADEISKRYIIDSSEAVNPLSAENIYEYKLIAKARNKKEAKLIRECLATYGLELTESILNRKNSYRYLEVLTHRYLIHPFYASPKEKLNIAKALMLINPQSIGKLGEQISNGINHMSSDFIKTDLPLYIETLAKSKNPNLVMALKNLKYPLAAIVYVSDKIQFHISDDKVEMIANIIVTSNVHDPEVFEEIKRLASSKDEYVKYVDAYDDPTLDVEKGLDEMQQYNHINVDDTSCYIKKIVKNKTNDKKGN